MTNKSPDRAGKPGVLALSLLFVALFGAWLVWSGIFKPLLIGLGVFSCALSVWLASRMGFFRYSGVVRGMPALPGYWFWLSKEIIASSLEVARLILRRDMPISPTIVELDASALSDSGQVILGNSITLSPGTVTLDVYEGKVKVHCLTQEGAKTLQSGDIQQRVQALGKR